ncbi:MAG TPA: nitrilase-related carbon-nitrogen hydrolase, partial [Sphingobacteriaceae bacterium]|nr:nitrilase-related carbon-nitrogen hydrolase [Sphingobacteriaceae bacterium]
MRIAIAQLNYHVANFQHNVSKIIATLDQARQQGVDLVVFAEMALSGYPAKDFWFSPDFIARSQQALEEVASHCKGIACILGTAVENKNGFGKSLYNVAVLLENGKIAGTTFKGLLPDYDVFDEFRYFQPANKFKCLEFKGLKLAVSVCEDMWNVSAPPLYPSFNDPMPVLAEEKPDLSINIAASPFAAHHFEKRQEVMAIHAKRADSPLLYVNQVGAHADLIFDGRSMVYSASGEMVDELSAFEEDFRIYEFKNGHLQFENGPEKGVQEVRAGFDTQNPIALIHQALLLGIRDFFQKSGFKKAILGLSGGLDSAVVAVLACEALGPDNVLAVLMPSAYSS